MWCLAKGDEKGSYSELGDFGFYPNLMKKYKWKIIER